MLLKEYLVCIHTVNQKQLKHVTDTMSSLTVIHSSWQASPNWYHGITLWYYGIALSVIDLTRNSIALNIFCHLLLLLFDVTAIIP